MSDKDSSDVLMYFVRTEGSPAITAESMSQLVPGDKLTADFVANRFFEAQNFAFSMELTDDESGVLDAGADARTYSRWRSLPTDQPKPTPPFMTEPHDVSITRSIDMSSAILLKHCLETDRFAKVVLVKRARAPKTGMLTGILRMEFSKVWLKAIEWEDGDAVKETCKFKYASVKVTYIKRKPDGSVASSWPCEWSGVQHG